MTHTLATVGGGATSYYGYRWVPGGSTAIARSNDPLPSSGKWFWEVAVTARGTSSLCRIGLCTSAHPTTGTHIGVTTDGIGRTVIDGLRYNNINQFSTAVFLSLSWLVFAYDAATRKLWTGAVDLTTGAITWDNSGNPGAGTGEVYTVPSGTWYIAMSGSATDQDIRFVTGYANRYLYNAPSGFLHLETMGLLGPNDVIFDSANARSTATISESGRRLTAGGTGSGQGILPVPITAPAYWECEFVTAGGGMMAGVTSYKHLFNLSDSTALQNNGATYRSDTGAVWVDGSSVATYSTFAAGDKVMFAFDPTSGKMWAGKNGTWQNSGNPAAGTGQVGTVSRFATMAYSPTVSGSTSASIRIHMRPGDWTYSKPTGFNEVNFVEGGISNSGAGGAGFMILDEHRERLVTRRRSILVPRRISEIRRLAA